MDLVQNHSLFPQGCKFSSLSKALRFGADGGLCVPALSSGENSQPRFCVCFQTLLLQPLRLLRVNGWPCFAQEHLHTHLFPLQQPLGCVLCSACQLQFQLFPKPSVTVLRAQLRQQVEKFIIKNAQSKWILLGTLQLQTAAASVHLWIVSLRIEDLELNFTSWQLCGFSDSLKANSKPAPPAACVPCRQDLLLLSFQNPFGGELCGRN